MSAGVPKPTIGSDDKSADSSDLAILIAEDERAIAVVVAEVVTDMGYQAVVTAHGQQALEAARRRWPVLLITDLMMPRMSGEALIEALRGEATALGKPMPPVLLVTAASMAYARRARPDAILRKPFNLTDLESAVIRLLSPQDTPATDR